MSSRRVTITIVSREAGEIVDSVIDSMLADILPPQKMDIQEDWSHTFSLKTKLNHTSQPNYDLFQGKCYQQYVGNFCGYHASFAYICVLQVLEKSPGAYDIESAGSFWTFKKSIEDFLFRYRESKKMDAGVWPWRDNDILYGDFERTYNTVLQQHSHIFLDFISKDTLEFMEHTWEFQYRNLVCSDESRCKLQDKIQYFKKYRKGKPLVFVLMLAITNHWTCLIAVKTKQKTEFWFFDSNNTQCLNFSVSEIAVYLAALGEERVSHGKPPLKPFMLNVYSQAILDTQLSLRLLVKLLKGEQDLEIYSFNRRFEVFGQYYESLLGLDSESEEFLSALKLWCTQYKHNLRTFFRNPINKNHFYEYNHTIFCHLIKHIHKHQRQHIDLRSVSDCIEAARLSRL